MTIHLEHDKQTDVAFVDICEAAANVHIEVIDVTEDLGLKCQVLARINAEDGTLFGLIIQDYGSFRREIRRKYIAFAVDRLLALIIDAARGAIVKNHIVGRQHPVYC